MIAESFDNARFNSLYRCEILIGFGTNPVIPASWADTTFSLKVLAVIAMIGIVFASGRASARIAIVVSSPFISGIIISIKMIWKLPVGLSSNISSACFPFSARQTTAPCVRSSSMAISAFRSLSSARRMVTPCRLVSSAGASGGFDGEAKVAAFTEFTF